MILKPVHSWLRKYLFRHKTFLFFKIDISVDSIKRTVLLKLLYHFFCLKISMYSFYVLCIKVGNYLPYYVCNVSIKRRTYSHIAFSSNLFHRQITQKHFNQLSDPENKKCSPWKVFGKKPHSNTLDFSPGEALDARKWGCQHYIGPKMTFCPFWQKLLFCRNCF